MNPGSMPLRSYSAVHWLECWIWIRETMISRPGNENGKMKSVLLQCLSNSWRKRARWNPALLPLKKECVPFWKNLICKTEHSFIAGNSICFSLCALLKICHTRDWRKSIKITFKHLIRGLMWGKGNSTFDFSLKSLDCQFKWGLVIYPSVGLWCFLKNYASHFVQL